MLLQMTNDLREKINSYIKNRIDISELIKGVAIKGEDFSDSIIKDFTRVNEDLSGLKISRSTIGAEGKITNISGNKIIDCKIDDVQFKGLIYFRKNYCLNSDFSGSIMHNVEYQYTNFDHCKFCETCIRLGSTYGYKSRFSEDTFGDWGKMLNLDIKQKQP